MSTAPATSITVAVHWDAPTAELSQRWSQLCDQLGLHSPSRYLEWLSILRDGLGHRPVLLAATNCDEIVGLLPLVYMHTALFGKFLVGLPYLNVGGPVSIDEHTSRELIARAVSLADELDVKHLELRNEQAFSHPAFNRELTEKVHMRLALPQTSDELWQTIGPKVRNQVRKAEKEGLTFEWGQSNLLPEFYDVFSRNMRDLGTPVFGRKLFESILRHLNENAEICVVRHGPQTIAAGLLIHGSGVTEVPSASSLRKFNHLNANMLLYWRMLVRTIERGQQVFDFGRSSADSNTYRFKSQWGASPQPAVWQYYVRRGNAEDLRPNNPKNQRRIAVWKRLPLWLTRLAGPAIVRGIP